MRGAVVLESKFRQYLNTLKYVPEGGYAPGKEGDWIFETADRRKLVGVEVDDHGTIHITIELLGALLVNNGYDLVSVEKRVPNPLVIPA